MIENSIIEEGRLIERDLKILAKSENYLHFQFSKIEKYIGRRVLEIGAGIGNHTKRILNHSPDLLIALEKELSFCKILKNKFDGRIEVLCADLNKLHTFEEYLKSKTIDTVVAINVLEHIKDDLVCLTNLTRGITSRGRILIIIPAFDGLYSTLDRRYGHFRRYNKSIVQSYSKKLELNIIHLSYFNVVGGLAWYLFAKIGKFKHMNNRGMTLFDRLSPILSVIESNFYNFPFGLSLVAVLEKK